jgi:hypothetical protein
MLYTTTRARRRPFVAVGKDVPRLSVAFARFSWQEFRIRHIPGLGGRLHHDDVASRGRLMLEGRYPSKFCQ